ncbi:MAG: CvpA family protein [Clostridia bacterium]|nr:CvpA family protein [Clostridia bacterium]
MDPINVDFSSKSVVPEAPKGSNLKRVIISLIFALIIGAVAYYVMLPALNFKAIEFYIYIGVIIFAYIGIYGIASKAYFRPEYMEYAKNKVKIPIALILVLVVFVGVGYAVGAEIFRAKDYAELIDVKEGNFAEEIEEIDFSAVPRLDKDSSNMIATRALGELSDYVSQFVVNSYYSTQINYKGTPVRVQSLDYGDVFKWLKNTKEGIPAYIIVDMTTQKAETVRLEEGMKYSPAEHFNEYLIRHVRFKYPSLILGDPSFEIDETGRPFWIVPVLDKTIGLFGGTDVIGAVIVDSINGDTTLVSTSLDGTTKLPTDKFVSDKEFQWLDQVYSAAIVNQQYNYYGKYNNGFWNSIIGQENVKITSSGYNYLALNDDVYMYTGVTSISSDQSIIGFILINQRTKESVYYQQAGALEETARTSAQGKVQEKGYIATFPILLNVSGEPTYFMALKDSSQLVKMYAMVNVEQSTVVGVGNTLAECTENYAAELKANGVNVNVDVDSMENEEDAPVADFVEITGKVAEIRSVITGGETYFYIRLADNTTYYKVAVKDAEKIVILNVGDEIAFVVDKAATGDIVAVNKVK